MKKKALRVIFISVLVLVLIVALVPVGFFINYGVKANRNKNTLGKAETQFTTDETGCWIANIPYGEYVTASGVPDGAVIPAVNENARGEENAKAINEAIMALSGTGGGIVGIPKGEFKITTIELKDNITLFVPYGSKLVSLNCEENEKSLSPLRGAVIVANGAKNIEVTGGGTICGSGASYVKVAEEESPLYALKEFNMYTRVIEARKRIRFGKDTARNNIIKFTDCKGVNVNNVILEESAFWTFVLEGCDDVDVNRVVIDNDMHVANSDGIDITGGNGIDIRHCFIATGDDGIVLKPINYAISDVTVTDCIISSYANCFKIGTETQKDVENVNVSNCYFFIPDGMTYGYSGIAVESADGSHISKVTVEDITMDGVSSPLLIWLGNRMKFENKTVGSISDITVRNVNATNTEMPSAITGCKVGKTTYFVENIRLENFRVAYRDTGENLSVKKKVSENSMTGYPEITRISHNYFIDHKFSGYWDLPCYGIFIRHAKNTDYSGYKCTPRSCNTLEFIYKSD